jgi:hypothetical protein
VAAAAFAIKTADTPRANTIIPTPDPDLQLPGISAGAHQLFVYLIFTSAAAVGSKWGIHVPNVLYGQIQGIQLDSTQSASQNQVLAFNFNQNLGTFPQAGSITTAHGTAGFTLSAPGTLTLDWSQAASNATALILKQGSWIQCL